MYPVTLERSLSSTEVGVWGPCLLCIQNASIVLYSEDGCSKLHHWSAGVVKRMTLEGDQLVLLASRYAVCILFLVSLYAMQSYYCKWACDVKLHSYSVMFWQNCSLPVHSLHMQS